MFLALPDVSGVKVSVMSRVLAKVIDLFLIFFVSLVLPYPLGPLAGFAYSLFGDGVQYKGFRGQSVGKKLLKIRVVQLVRNEPADFRDSAIRNIPVGIATFFAIIPVWGWFILAFVGIPLMIMEIYLIVSGTSGHRLGDLMADTEVVEDER